MKSQSYRLTSQKVKCTQESVIYLIHPYTLEFQIGGWSRLTEQERYSKYLGDRLKYEDSYLEKP